MKKIIFIFSYTFYFIFLLGLFLHTSSHPEIFGKYTFKYFVLLLLLVVFFFAFLWIVSFIGKEKTKIIIKKKKIVLTPFKKLLLMCLLLVILFLPVELLLRDKYKGFESNQYEYTLDNFHPFLQFQLANDYASPINSFGFRGEEIKKEKSEDTYRIFVLGGSTVLSRGTDFEKSSVRLLENMLQEKYPDKNIEIINAGQDGYTSEHSLILYLFKIKDFDPDMIIMWHGINDWYYSCSPAARSYKSFQADYSHFLGADASMAYSHFKIPPIVSFKLVTVDFFLKFMKDNWYSDLITIAKKNKPPSNYYTEAEKSKQYEMVEKPSLTVYERNLQSFINATKSDNVQLLLGNQPVLYHNKMSEEIVSRIYFPVLHCTKDGKYPSLASVIHALNQFNATTQKIAETNQIAFVDLEKALPKNLHYFIDDVHYTDRGNEEIAQTLFKFITEQNLIE